MKRFALLLAGMTNAAFICPASAFMFADGTTAQCIARGQVIVEAFAPMSDPHSRIAWPERRG
jgi:hypothetical protein